MNYFGGLKKNTAEIRFHCVGSARKWCEKEMCVSVCVRACMPAFVCERENEKERDRETDS